MAHVGVDALIERLRLGAGRFRAEGLRGSSRAYLLARAATELGRPVVVLTPGLSEAKAFASELRFFLGASEDADGLPWDSRVCLFPPWDTLLFEGIPPHPEISAQRTAALTRARHGGPFVFVAPVEATFFRLPPPQDLDAATLTVSTGERLDREALLRQLAAAGYRRASQVEERGELSARGGIVDLYPPHYANPLRLELFGDEVESIRSFDPATQRSTGKRSEVVLLPAREVVAGEERAEAVLAALRNRCHELGMNRSETAAALEPFKISPFARERECLLPYYYERAASFWDYFPPGTPVVFDMEGEANERIAQFAEEAAKAGERAREAKRLTPSPEASLLSPEAWRDALAAHPALDLESLEFHDPKVESYSFATSGNEDVAASLKRARGAERLLSPLVSEIEKARADGFRVYLVCRGRGAAQRLSDLLEEYGIHLGSPEPFARPGPEEGGSLKLAHGLLARGFRFPAERLFVVTDAEIFGQRAKSPKARRGFRSSLSDLEEGGHVVHVDFGIGLYRGMVRLTVQDIEGDYLFLEYAGGDRLYLPVTRLNLVQRYAAPGEGEVRLDKLGGKGWEKARKKALEGIEQMAHELLDLYARRSVARRPGYPAQGLAYREFEATFPYEETRDQAAAIDDVMADLAGERPMDRLICGDVGYGKTEVAIRAAFRVVEAGRQVAVLAPTTVLAAQHFQSFRRRFEGYPVLVEMMSRFVDKAGQSETAKKVAEGKVDVLIGTHRLLGSDLRFKNLGLVVVDEEHRFGVAQKEKLKRFRSEADVLCLSATPIPRTLQMGLTGVRDLSIIETPPADRLAVRTRLARFDDDVVREAVTRELNRGGQVYFVHNRVQSIAGVAEHLKALLPSVRMGVGHGQMADGDLQAVMEKFAAGELDMLVCTAIIESGLDIPRANTILINRADIFGLADLYQLRGRVGRSNLRAYCYLLVPEERELTEDARKRLEALQQFTELGAGFKVAMHDLEIRGAGDFLGKNQSGHIAAIGFDLYSELLDDAVRRLKGEPFGRPPEPEIRLRLPAHFPEAFVEDPRLRLELYERLTRMESPEALDDAAYELVDRFGPAPGPVANLIEVMKIRLALMEQRALALDYTGEELVLTLDETSPVDVGRLVALAQAEPARCRLTPDSRVKWRVGQLAEAPLLAEARDLLSRVAGI